ncbi:lipopolysaccharide biosynthesis protein [Zobellia uliginosa]|uniref:lipopolysaccharide biosynthesis protein n=1 Tax=Zobellia uliginosa TaxID=143224 RepID=UPI001C06CD63|nr:polysaccharide biosynthesis protein [Zobellia uliginosa]MBU2948032.1 polysaccharide biosynthesis protein [Zobellia uliginosa]
MSFKIVKNISETIGGLINRGQKRSVKAKKNILASFFIKGLSILTGFIMVPLTIGYVDKEQYGIWLTLSSVVGWFSFFDVGLGNGLRNKLAIALAENDMERAKSYVSSTYAILGFLIGIVLVLFFLIQPLINWQIILNTTSIDADELRLVAISTFSFFCLNFILKLIYSIFKADQRPAFEGFFNLLSNVVSLTIVFILTHTTSGSLLYLSLALGMAPLVILVIASVFLFNGRYGSISPSYQAVNKGHFKELFGLGFRFFIVQLSSIIIFSTDNMIITQAMGPSEVPAYAVAHKYFGLITAVFTIVSMPFWSAYTEAYASNDINWIKATNKKLIKVWLGLLCLSIFMLSISSWFYEFWVPEIEVPLFLSVMMCAYVNIVGWGNIFVVFINGVGKIQLQLVFGIAATILNIPLSYFFAKTLDWGASGVIVATIICLAYGPILAPIQFNKIVLGKATGLWNR